MLRLLRNVFEELVHIVNNPLILTSDFPNLPSFTGIVTAEDLSG
jgi:hypothetical protein